MIAPPKAIYLPHFQPIIDVATGQIGGHEVLARIQNHRGKVSSAGHLFSDPKIDPDALLQLDRSVRQLALEKFCTARPSGFISINIAPAWLNRSSTHGASPTIDIIRALDIDPSRVVIEITESVSNLSALKQAIKAYQTFGLAIAIDDFGAGEAHIDRIIELEPDYVKLDIALFKRAVRSEGLAREVVMAMARLAERTGFDLVIEGVESQPELIFALECGARFVQGFYFAEAKMQFTQTAAYEKQITQVRRRVLQEKVGLHREDYRQETQTNRAAAFLQRLVSEEGPEALLNIPSPCDAIVRCFITDNDGNQISDNYECADNRFHSKQLTSHFNWSWRPYFPQIVAYLDEVHQHIGRSTPYKDVNTGLLVQTLGVRMTSNTLLLIDIAANEASLTSTLTAASVPRYATHLG